MASVLSLILISAVCLTVSTPTSDQFLPQRLFIVYGVGMCNNNQVLEYSAVTAMIDHENDDHVFFLIG